MDVLYTDSSTYGMECLHACLDGKGKRGLTIYALAKLDNLAEFHGFVPLSSEMGQDTRTQSDVPVEIAFSEAVTAEFELRRLYVG